MLSCFKCSREEEFVELTRKEVREANCCIEGQQEASLIALFTPYLLARTQQLKQLYDDSLIANKGRLIVRGEGYGGGNKLSCLGALYVRAQGKRAYMPALVSVRTCLRS